MKHMRIHKRICYQWFVFILFVAGLFWGIALSGNAAVKKTYRSTDGSVIPGAYAKGIDVSKNNGEIDWKKVKESGVEFAMIRCGYGSNITSQDDSRWLENAKGCEAVGIPYGVYLYSYADTKAKAVSEANHVLRLLKGRKITYPVYLDMEDASVFSKTTVKTRALIAKTFCSRIKAAGYKASVYSDKYNFEKELTDPVFDTLGRWVAHYSRQCGYSGTYQIWQATNKGRVSGINGDVDIDYLISSQAFVKPVIKVTAGKKKAKVTWKPKKTGSTCEIYYALSKTGKWKKVQKSGKTGACLIKGLKAGRTYYFRIRISRKVRNTVVYSRYSAIKKCKIRR